jgi:tetratricopeptide (TPR) repeat protein
MPFDPENAINKLCAQGMQLEGEGKPAEAAALFNQAWKEATNDKEKFTAAHYVARHQNSISDKLKWDIIAVEFASKIKEEEIKSSYPSLYLNIAKGFEDLGDPAKALEHYQLAVNYTSYLPQDGYGSMIKSGIVKGIERLQQNNLK